MTGNYTIQSGRRIGFRTLIALAGFFSTAGAVCGQEALRISTAGDLAAAAQRQAESSIGYYNLLLGPVAWQFSSGLAVDYNDNIQDQQNAQGDFIFIPNVNAQMHWPVTQVNDLNLSVAAGYSDYLQHQELNRFYINRARGLPSTFTPATLSSICTTGFPSPKMPIKTSRSTGTPLMTPYKTRWARMRCGI